jgi:hypothetical protein
MRSLRPHFLSVFFGLIFVLALGGQSIAGLAEFNQDQLVHGNPQTSYLAFITSSDFVVDVAENWQSEFLAVGCMVAFSIFLRQRGSAESKPVGTPHAQASTESE